MADLKLEEQLKDNPTEGPFTVLIAGVFLSSGQLFLGGVAKARSELLPRADVHS